MVILVIILIISGVFLIKNAEQYEEMGYAPKGFYRLIGVISFAAVLLVIVAQIKPAELGGLTTVDKTDSYTHTGYSSSSYSSKSSSSSASTHVSAPKSVIDTPYVGMSESIINETGLGEASEVKKCLDYDKLKVNRRYKDYIWKDGTGREYFKATVWYSKDASTAYGYVGSINDMRRDNSVTRPSSSASSSSKYRYDPYDVYEYEDADSFADDWAEEFAEDDTEVGYDDGYEEAYDYWNDHH